MINDEVVAVDSAEAVAPDMAGVVARAKAEESKNHIVRRKVESVAVPRLF